MTRGQVGSLRLTCTTLAFATSRRFIPAHSNLGPNADNLGPKPCTETQNKARRTNQIAFLPLPWAQEVSGSNPDAPTTNFRTPDIPPPKSFQYSSFSGGGANLKLSAFCVYNDRFMMWDSTKSERETGHSFYC